jgi:VWFA-related protein
MIGLRPLRPVLLASVLFAPCLLAQQKTSTPDQTPASTAPTLAVDARLVNLPVVVRDKKGALIQNLTKDDFTLQVDGKPQTIRYFDKDTNLPLTLGLLVDTSLSQREVIDEERSASSVFLDQMLTTPKDRAFIMQFAAESELLQDLTSSRPLLQAALKEIDTPGKSSGSSSDNPDTPTRRPRGGGGTVLYDALFLASDEIMRKQTGRKAIIILSDGGDRGSRETLVKSIEAAQRADTIIYAIYFKGEPPHQNSPRDRGGNPGGGYPGGGYPGGNCPGGGYPGGGYPGGGYPGGGYPGGGYPGGGYPGGGYPGGGCPGGTNGGNYPTGSGHIDGKKNLERMAQETGGRFFEVKKDQNVAQIYNQIAEELRAQYRLGYTPSQDAASSGYHRIDLTLRQKGLLIQTRDGYYTGK